jgi:hypothetical protein
MSKTVTLKMSDSAYELLIRASVQSGQTPEQVINRWLESRVEPTVNDPLLQLAGAFEFDHSDISENHDRYVGESVKVNDA